MEIEGLRRAGQYFDRPERWIGYPPLFPPPHSTRTLRSLELSPVLNFPKKCASKINRFRCGRAMSYLLESLFAPFYSSLSLPFALRRNFAPRRRPVGCLAIGQVSCGRRRLPILVPHPSLPPKSSKKAQGSSSEGGGEKILR